MINPTTKMGTALPQTENARPPRAAGPDRQTHPRPQHGLLVQFGHEHERCRARYPRALALDTVLAMLRVLTSSRLELLRSSFMDHAALWTPDDLPLQGLGLMRLTDEGWGDPDRDPAVLVHAAVEAGVTLLNTAAMYRNEELVGRAVVARSRFSRSGAV